MRNTALVSRIVALTVLVGVMAMPAHAQQEASEEPTGAFCALAGLDLLAALDGSWTIHQEQGKAHAGMMTIQLPPPPPTPVTFAFNPQTRVVDVRSANLADEMIMFPVSPVQQAAADELIGEPPAGNPSGPVCAWLAAPTLIGTNVYVGWNFEQWLFVTPGPKSTCGQIEETMASPPPKEEDYEDPTIFEIAQKNYSNSKAFYYEYCQDELKELPGGGTLEMEMTLVLRFTSANSGAGTVYYTGQTDKAKFAASAPVTITR